MGALTSSDTVASFLVARIADFSVVSGAGGKKKGKNDR